MSLHYRHFHLRAAQPYQHANADDQTCSLLRLQGSRVVVNFETVLVIRSCI